MPIIRIYSELYSGQSANIIFYPLTGGSINLGTQEIPYDYSNDYYFGKYVLTFEGSSDECELNVPIPSPTPTNTQTPSVTPTQTPTNTTTPTETPTNTPTPTQTQTNTTTPTETPTNTPTPTQTPTQTEPFNCNF